MKKYLIGFISMLLFVSCFFSCEPIENQGDKLFSNLSSEYTGIDFSNTLVETDTFNIYFYEFYYNGSGVAAGDLNNDGLTDLFFGGNMKSSRIYLNKGNLQFKDISKSSGIDTFGKWVTGINLVDINNDGWLDIYVSVGGNIKDDYKNMFYISNADPVHLKFEEHAAKMGLNDAGYSTQSAFFDYDQDGDLDMYLVTSAMNIPNKNRVRKIRKDGSMPNTDKLYRNDGIDSLTNLPRFIDISKEAGIQVDGFGLGVCISDINNDGWPDIYVANDYISNDLLYINQKNGRFINQIDSYFKHMSYSAMGADIADVNNDGLVDLVSVDMLPPDNYRKRIMAGNGRSYNRSLLEQDKGYLNQHIRNTLQINNGNNTFSELGQLAGIHETDWSWAPLLADFDNDGLRDLFIANGIPQDITHMDFVSYQASQTSFSIPNLLKELRKMGNVKISNYIFKNEGDVKFRNVTEDWGLSEETYSNSAVYTDLDNDGDLDLVINNINDKALVYQNNLNPRDTTRSKTNYLQISLHTETLNPNAIGGRIDLYYADQHQLYENFPTRGFLSTLDYKAHFGLGKYNSVDSIIVRWPDGSKQKFYDIPANQWLKLKKGNSTEKFFNTESAMPSIKTLFTLANKSLGINFVHKEREFNDFKIQPLVPHQYSKEGPGIAVADINGDGMEDFYIGAATGSAGQLFLQKKSGQFSQFPLGGSTDYEDMGVLFFDADNDGDQDLYVVSGGTGLPPGHPLYRDRLYINDNGHLVHHEEALPDIRVCGSKVTAADFDKDGDLDLFIGARINLEQYPIPPKSTLLLNESQGDKIKFKDISQDIKGLESIGMVSDAIWSDYNNDGWVDLILCGEWMPITILKNEKGILKNVTASLGLDKFTGWWNSLTATDFDKDGDIDYVAGNLGLNSRFTATNNEPLEIFAKDFDQNGSIDPICTYYIDTIRYPIYNRDLLFSQLSFLHNRMPLYADYARTSFVDMFTENELRDSYTANCKFLASAFIENKGDHFSVSPLPRQAQVAPIFGLLAGDYDENGTMDIVGIGNSFSSDMETGNYDALNGLNLVYKDGDFEALKTSENGFVVSGDGKGLAQLTLANGQTLLLAAQNDGPLLAYSVEPKGRRYMVDNQDAYAILQYASGRSERCEFYYGGGYLSHSSRFLLIPENVKLITIVNFIGESRELVID